MYLLILRDNKHKLDIIRTLAMEFAQFDFKKLLKNSFSYFFF